MSDDHVQIGSAMKERGRRKTDCEHCGAWNCRCACCAWYDPRDGKVPFHIERGIRAVLDEISDSTAGCIDPDNAWVLDQCIKAKDLPHLVWIFRAAVEKAAVNDE